MADLSPAELAKLDQIHSAVMDRLTALVSSAVDGIRAEGEPFTASTLAGQAQATDHTSVSTLFAAALIRLARHQIADEKRAESRIEALSLLAEYVDNEPCSLDHHGHCQNHGGSGSDSSYCRNVRAHLILGTKLEATP